MNSNFNVGAGECWLKKLTASAPREGRKYYIYMHRWQSCFRALSTSCEFKTYKGQQSLTTW
jgi:hypothetical protein